MANSLKRFGSWVGQIATSAATNEDPDPAFREFHQIIHLRPKDPESYYRRGLAYSKAEKNKQAVVDFDEHISGGRNAAGGGGRWYPPRRARTVPRTGRPRLSHQCRI